MINVSGHRMGTAEVEAALVSHPKVSEAAVVGFPHNLLRNADSDRASRLGAQGDRADRFTRSHPICPRLAQDPLGQDHAPHPAQIAEDDFSNLGDISTLADPAVVDDLIETGRTS